MLGFSSDNFKQRRIIIMEQNQPPRKTPSSSFQEFMDWYNRIQYVENPKKMANYTCCAAIFKTLSQEYTEIHTSAKSIEGGMEFTLRLNTVPYFPDFNNLLGELISRCSWFSVSRDPEEPTMTLLTLTFFTCDRIADGRLLLNL